MHELTEEEERAFSEVMDAEVDEATVPYWVYGAALAALRDKDQLIEDLHSAYNALEEMHGILIRFTGWKVETSGQVRAARL